jgi:hypothetical protein
MCRIMRADATPEHHIQRASKTADYLPLDCEPGDDGFRALASSWSPRGHLVAHKTHHVSTKAGCARKVAPSMPARQEHRKLKQRAGRLECCKLVARECGCLEPTEAVVLGKQLLVAKTVLVLLSPHRSSIRPEPIVDDGLWRKADREARILHTPREIGIHATTERLVETADRVECRSTNSEIPPAGVGQMPELRLQAIGPNWITTAQRARRVQAIGLERTTYEVEPIECIDHRRNPRIRNDVVAIAEEKPFRSCKSHSEVASPADSRAVRTDNAQFAQPSPPFDRKIPCPIGRAVIHQDDVPTAREPLSMEGLELRAEDVAFVPNGNDDARLHGRVASRRPSFRHHHGWIR